MNRTGPAVLGSRPDLARLDPDAVSAALAGGARLVDGRSRRAVTAGHIPGSLTIELGDTFASYVGWILPVGTPLVLVLSERAGAADDAVDQLVRIGFDRLGHARGRGRCLGCLGAPDRRDADGHGRSPRRRAALGSTPDRPRRARPRRTPRRGPDRDAIELSLPRLIAGDPTALSAGAPVTIACRSGSRALIAAGLVEAQGHPVRVVERGGIPDVAARLAAGEATQA